MLLLFSIKFNTFFHTNEYFKTNVTIILLIKNPYSQYIIPHCLSPYSPYAQEWQTFPIKVLSIVVVDWPSLENTQKGSKSV